MRPLQRPYFNFTFCTGHHKPFTQQTHIVCHNHYRLALFSTFFFVMPLLVGSFIHLYSLVHSFCYCCWWCCCSVYYSSFLFYAVGVIFDFQLTYVRILISHFLFPFLVAISIVVIIIVIVAVVVVVLFAIAITFSSFGLCDACLNFNSPCIIYV